MCKHFLALTATSLKIANVNLCYCYFEFDETKLINLLKIKHIFLLLICCALYVVLEA